MDFAYDVFISYGSDDREYARRLSDSLKHLSPAHTPFFDYESVRAGDDWEARIQQALESSRHLIVLWSDHAKKSDWVSREIYTFYSVARPKANSDRRLIFLNLQGMNHAMKGFQQINRVELIAGYPDSASITDGTWTDVMRDVDEGLNPAKRLLPVPLVVLTMTHGQLSDFSAERWQQIRDDFGLSHAFVSARYGPTRAHWRPFGGTQTIGEVLTEIKDQMTAAFQAYRVYWKAPDETFWTDVQAAKRFVKNEFDTGEISILIVDPVALHRAEVYQRLMFFQESLSNCRVVVITLPPFNVQPEVLRLRTALLNRGTPYFDDYFQPPMPPRRRVTAQCGWNVTDMEDIQRLILAAAVQLGGETERAGGSTFLRHGTGR